MKKLSQYFMMVVALLMTTSLFQSCMDDDDDDRQRYPNALVTAKTASDQTFYLQLDERTTLLPTNYKQSPFGKEVRALVNYTEVPGNVAPYSKAVRINWIDSILTKHTVPNRFGQNDSVYGNDPVEIVNDWVTIAEDGYLTLRFRTNWGPYGTPHTVNLLTNYKGENPYELEFRHNSNGNWGNVVGDGLVAFNLKDLPDTQGKTVKLRLKWRSFTGMKTAEFNYCTRQQTDGNLLKDGQEKFLKTLE